MGTIRKSGGYRKLATFQTSTIIYDATVWFCEKFLDSRSRTIDQQIAALEEQFVTEGGYSERLAAERLKARQQQKTTDPVPDCPKCGKTMVLRTAKTGRNSGNPFWGCSAYPDCKGVAEV